MNAIFRTLENLTGISKITFIKIVYSISAIIILFVVRLIILKIVWKNTEDAKTRYIWKKTLTYLISIFGIIIISNIWIKAFGQLGTFLGLLSAGIAIALKEPLSNFAGWLFIIARRPFTIGDRIQIGEIKGDVIDIRLSQFSLMEIGNWVDAEQSTGRVIHIPNGKIFIDSIANYSKGFQYIWNEIPVLITFESNWQKAKDILLSITKKHAESLSKHAERKLKEASKRFMIYYTQLTPTIYTSIKESGVLLTIRYLCEPKKRRITENAIWEDILVEFEKHNDIDFAYPTTRFYNYLEEKKNKP